MSRRIVCEAKVAGSRYRLLSRADEDAPEEACPLLEVFKGCDGLGVDRWADAGRLEGWQIACLMEQAFEDGRAAGPLAEKGGAS